MTERSERRVRLRLTRRRTAPRVVRARVPETRLPEPEAPPDPASSPEPEPEPEPDPEAERPGVRARLREARWGHIITIGGTGLAAVAAIGGLWAQAVATYWTQQTAKDQLGQSREDGRREETAQASRITFWTEETKSLDSSDLHVLNRSLDAVTSVYFVLDRYSEGLYISGSIDLPPCTEKVYDVGKMRLFLNGHHMKKDDGLTAIELDDLAFTDSHGRTWERTRTGLYEGLPPKPKDVDGYIVIADEVSVKRAEACGDDHG